MQDDSASPPARQPALERRLATIMIADVVGYRRIMGENEERTFAKLAHRRWHPRYPHASPLIVSRLRRRTFEGRMAMPGAL